MSEDFSGGSTIVSLDAWKAKRPAKPKTDAEQEEERNALLNNLGLGCVLNLKLPTLEDDGA